MNAVPEALDRRFRDAAAAEGLIDVSYDVADTPVGPLLVAVTERGVCRYPRGTERPVVIGIWQTRPEFSRETVGARGAKRRQTVRSHLHNLEGACGCRLRGETRQTSEYD